MAVKRTRGPGKKRPSPKQGVRARQSEAEATLEAIRTGAVDAVVVSGPEGERTLAIEGATHPYYALLDAMSDGAALLAEDGAILFGNLRFGEFAQAPIQRLHGSRIQQLIAPDQRAGFERFLRECAERAGAAEFELSTREGSARTPVRIALSTVSLGAYPGVGRARTRGGATVLMAIVTDLSERKQAEATRLELMKRLTSAEDDERRRIARALHDETGQSLTALLVGLRAIEGQSLTLDALRTAQRLRCLAARTVEEVGRLARGLHPSILDDLGLLAAVQRCARDYTDSFGIAVDLRQKALASRRLPALVQVTAYRIIQEALTNVARHAQCAVVGVELKHQGAMLDVLVRDSGVGFDAKAARGTAIGLGLHGMRERVALLGGAVTITSQPGHGTTVHARIPCGVATSVPRRTQRRPRRPRTP